MQRVWLLGNHSQQRKELISCGGGYLRDPHGFSSAVRVLNLSITTGAALAVDEADGDGVT